MTKINLLSEHFSLFPFLFLSSINLDGFCWPILLPACCCHKFKDIKHKNVFTNKRLSEGTHSNNIMINPSIYRAGDQILFYFFLVTTHRQPHSSFCCIIYGHTLMYLTWPTKYIPLTIQWHFWYTEQEI